MSGFSPSAGRNSNILSFSFIIENKTSLRRSSGLEMNNKNGVDRNFFFFFFNLLDLFFLLFRDLPMATILIIL